MANNSYSWKTKTYKQRVTGGVGTFQRQYPQHNIGGSGGSHKYYDPMTQRSGYAPAKSKRSTGYHSKYGGR